MADTSPNIPLPADVQVDLYAATGIAVGTQIILQSIGADEVRLSTKATEPLSTDGYEVVPRSYQAVNESGDSGAWAMSKGIEGLVNVREA